MTACMEILAKGIGQSKHAMGRQKKVRVEEGSCLSKATGH